MSGGAEQREGAARAAKEMIQKKRLTSVAVAPRQRSERARRITAQVKGAHAVVSDKDEDEYNISTGGMFVYPGVRVLRSPSGSGWVRNRHLVQEVSVRQRA